LARTRRSSSFCGVPPACRCPRPCHRESTRMLASHSSRSAQFRTVRLEAGVKPRGA